MHIPSSLFLPASNILLSVHHFVTSLAKPGCKAHPITGESGNVRVQMEDLVSILPLSQCIFARILRHIFRMRESINNISMVIFVGQKWLNIISFM